MAFGQRLRWTAWLATHAPRQGRYPYRPASVVERDQARGVADAVRYAHRHVPHWRETLDRLGLDPAEIAGPEELATLPIVERSDLQADPERFVSRERPLHEYVEFHSGGSTGAPVRVYQDRFALFRAAAYRERARRAIVEVGRIRGRPRRLAIADPPQSSGQDVNRAFRGVSLVPASVRVLERRVSIFRSPAESVEEINRFRPQILFSYGSYLEALFAHLSETGRDFHRPRVVTFASDGLSDSARRTIAEDFGIPVLGGYGAIEAFNMGFECEAHRGYHVSIDNFPMRLVDADGRDVGPGESGDVVVSNLVSRGTVLFNYRIGDVASWVPGPCPCGRTLPMISFLEGRAGDWLVSPTGDRLHAQAVRTLLSDERDVWSYQIVQETPRELRVALVVRAETDRTALRARVQAKFAERLGPGARTEVDFVEGLPRTPGGKVRSVVSLAHIS